MITREELRDGIIRLLHNHWLPNETSEKTGEKIGVLVDNYVAELDEDKTMSSCPICGGTSPASGRVCVCNNTGDASVAVTNLNRQLYNARQAAAVLRNFVDSEESEKGRMITKDELREKLAKELYSEHRHGSYNPTPESVLFWEDMVPYKRRLWIDRPIVDRLLRFIDEYFGQQLMENTQINRRKARRRKVRRRRSYAQYLQTEKRSGHPRRRKVTRRSINFTEKRNKRHCDWTKGLLLPG